MLKWWQKLKKTFKADQTPRKSVVVNLIIDGKVISRLEIHG